MSPAQYEERLVNLVSSPVGDDLAVLEAPLDHHVAVVAKEGRTVRLARTLGRPMRYFLAKRFDGPHLIVAERIDEIRRYAAGHGLLEQFHPSYTRMVPAHYVVELELRGCPDPTPRCRRFFTPSCGDGPADIDVLGRDYVEATRHALRSWLASQPADELVGVAFSGGVDSTAVLILARQAMQELGRPKENLRAFTLAFGPDARDARQAVETARALGLGDNHEVIEGDRGFLDPAAVIPVVEDYRPLDLQCAAMGLALLAGVRQRYPEWRLMLDGDGGDENLKDYPLEGTDITTHSVLNNLMLYHEGWGVESIKTSQTYSGGLSRAYTRTCMPARQHGFDGFSPFTVPTVIQMAERIPFVTLTDYDADRLYALKGQIVAAGIRQVAAVEMPVADKRRFQEGALSSRELEERLPLDKPRYRRIFDRLWDLPAPGAKAALAT